MSSFLTVVRWPGNGPEFRAYFCPKRSMEELYAWAKLEGLDLDPFGTGTFAAFPARVDLLVEVPNPYAVLYQDADRHIKAEGPYTSSEAIDRARLWSLEPGCAGIAIPMDDLDDLDSMGVKLSIRTFVVYRGGVQQVAA